jgi:D-amino peptidase
MHVGVFADIEGSFGIYRMRQCRVGTGEWQYGRACLTEDVNQVVQGAFDGGAGQVTVKDTHEMGFNCLIDKLDSRAEYIGGHYARPSFFGKYTDYDLVLYVAIHAASGTENAFFPHTHYGIFSEVRLNGRPVCEMDIYAAYLGEMGIPVGFVSGEDVAVEQALNCLPWARSVVVDKCRETYQAGEKSLRYLASGREKLQKVAAEAVQEIDSMKPLIVPGPLHFEAEFRTEKLANRYNTWGFRQEGRVVFFDAKNMMDGFDELNKLVFFPKKIYPFRRPFLFMMRNYSRIRATYFAPTPVVD